MRQLRLLFVLFAGLRFAGGPCLWAQSEVLDQLAQPGLSPTMNLGGLLLISQTFTPGVPGRLVDVRFTSVPEQLNFPHDYATTYLTVRQLGTSGLPDGDILAKRSVVGRDIHFRFDETPVYLDAGKQYALQLMLNPAISGYLHLSLASPDYLGGDLWKNESHVGVWQKIDGYGALAPIADLAFQTRMIPGLPPVRMISPAADTWSFAGAPVPLQAALAPGMDPATQVEFFANGVSVGDPVAAPYEWNWPAAGSGNVALTARIVSPGPATESAPVLHAVVNPSIANDDIAQAEMVTGRDVSRAWYNGDATKQPVESLFGSNVGGRSVWFRWTAPESGTFTLSGVGRTTDLQQFRLLMAVFVYHPSTGITLSAGNGYDGLNPVQLLDPGSEVVWFQAEAGREYYLMVDGYFGEAGICEWSLGLRPLNDAFSRRTLLETGEDGVASSTLGATVEPAEPGRDGLVPEKTVWYSWRSPVDAAAVVTVRSSEFKPQVNVYRGLDLPELTQVELASSTGTSDEATVSFAAGTTNAYALQIGAAGGSGSFSIDIELETTRFLKPRPGQVLPVGATMDIVLEPAQPVPEIAYIELFANDSPLATLTAPPFVIEHQLTGEGPVTLRASTRLNDGTLLASEFRHVLAYQPGALPRPRLFAGPQSRRSFAIQASGIAVEWGGLDPHVTCDPADLAVAPTWELVDSGTYLGRHIPRRFESLVPQQEIKNIAEAWAPPYWRVYLLTTDGLLFEDGIEVPPPAPGEIWTHIDRDMAVASNGRVYQRKFVGFADLNLPHDGSGIRQLALNLGITQNGTLFELTSNASGGFNFVPATGPAAGLVWDEVLVTTLGRLAMTIDGRLYSWPSGAGLQLVPVPGGANHWQRVSCGGSHILALTSKGELYTWGRNWEGQLGLGSGAGVNTQLTPQRVPFPPGVSAWLDVAAGQEHSVALGDDCEVYTWGENINGQLGIGPAPRQPSPRSVPYLSQLCGHPELLADEITAGTVAFETRPNLTYHLEFSEDAANWTRSVPPVVGTGGIVVWQDPEIHGPGCPCGVTEHRLYRVVIDDAGQPAE